MYHSLGIYEHITFSALDRIINPGFLRLRVVKQILEDGKHKVDIEDIHFIVVRGSDILETRDVYEVRCTESVKKALFRYLNKTIIMEYKPDGIEWRDSWNDTLAGSPRLRYYKIADVWSVFSKAFVCKYMHRDDRLTILALFFNEDIEEREESGRKHNVIQIPMTEDELLRQQMDKVQEIEYDFEIDDYDKEREIYDDDENSWMDNNDDYWNVD